MKWTYRFKPSWEKPAVTITGRDYENLVEEVSKYFTDRKYSFNVESLRSHILKQNNQLKEPKPKTHSLSDVIKGATAMIKNVAGSSTTNHEIIRRSYICSKGANGSACPKMTQVSDCMGCGAAGKVASFVNKIRARFKGQINIPSEVQKKYCSVCDCALSLMVVTRYEDLKIESAEKIAERPDHCWLKRSSPNFTKE